MAEDGERLSNRATGLIVRFVPQFGVTDLFRYTGPMPNVPENTYAPTIQIADAFSRNVRIASICSGPMPQQPPITEAPSAIQRSIHFS